METAVVLCSQFRFESQKPDESVKYLTWVSVESVIGSTTKLLGSLKQEIFGVSF